MIHIYGSSAQPATDWTDTHNETPIRIRMDKDALLWCCCCGKQRPAGDCVVYSYYDGAMTYCADDKGCKDPKAIAEKRALEFQNRSGAQKARRSREKISGGGRV
jgi:hypothetical protein